MSAAASRPAVTETDEATPSLLEQMGGVSGLIASALPVIVLIPVNNLWGLRWALGAALGVAVVIGIWRIARKENLQPALSGVLGVAIGAFIALRTGEAKGFFLYGIWISALLAVLAVASVIVKWPLIGVVWTGINGEGMSWRNHPRVRRAYSLATLAWAVVFAARFIVQRHFYDTDSTTVLAIARIAMGLPLAALVVLFTIFMVKRATDLEHEQASHPAASTPAATPPEETQSRE